MLFCICPSTYAFFKFCSLVKVFITTSINRVCLPCLREGELQDCATQVVGDFVLAPSSGEEGMEKQNRCLYCFSNKAYD